LVLGGLPAAELKLKIKKSKLFVLLPRHFIDPHGVPDAFHRNREKLGADRGQLGSLAQ
jgi:hypothetical protein